MFLTDKNLNRFHGENLCSHRSVFIAADMSKTANGELFGVHITIGARDV